MFGTLWNFQKVVGEFSANGFLRLYMTLKVILNGRRPDLLPKVSLRRVGLIVKRPFH